MTGATRVGSDPSMVEAAGPIDGLDALDAVGCGQLDRRSSDSADGFAGRRHLGGPAGTLDAPTHSG